MSLNIKDPIVPLSPLGKSTHYVETYSPDLLFAIPRANERAEIGITHSLPFRGTDTWTAFELSWLTPSGKPEVAIAHINIPCNSPCLIESKSMKLYFNSFNQSQFDNPDRVAAAITRDLTNYAGVPVTIELLTATQWPPVNTEEFDGECLDQIDIATDIYEVDDTLLKSDASQIVEETLFTRLFRSNCLVTGQPDWASVQVRYRGPKIDRAGLLKYLISYRKHQGFHEQCIERIFTDIKRACNTEKLTVYGRFTRRGGLDINPFRSDFETPPENGRHFRQ